MKNELNESEALQKAAIDMRLMEAFQKGFVDGSKKIKVPDREQLPPEYVKQFPTRVCL